MKSNLRTRANYSPVKQMNYQHHEINYNPSTSSSQQSNDTATAIGHSHLQEYHVDSKNEQANEETNEENLEEVYLCDCCGVTRQLDPAMKYMPLFRSLFFFFNMLVFALGLANLGMGLWFRIDPKVYEIHKYIETQNFTIAGWIMLFGGFLAMLMSLIGCTATARQAIGMLVFYAIVMVALTLSFVASVVLLTIFGLGRQLENFLVKEIYEQIRRRTMNTELDLFMNTDAAQFLDFVQIKMRCCGATDFTDYAKLGLVPPTSCYAIATNFINAPGCGRAIRELLDIRAGMATAFTTGAAIAQLFAILLASLMVCSIYNWRANPRPAPLSPAASHLDDQLDLSQTHLKQLQQRPLQHERPITSIRV